MQTATLARALAQHRATQRPSLPAVQPERAAQPDRLIAAIARQGRMEARTLMEMARDREGFRQPWQEN